MHKAMGVGSGGQGHALPPDFINGIFRSFLLFFGLFLLFFCLFSVEPSGKGLIVLFFSFFCYFSVFFPLAPLKIFLPTPL